MIDTSVKGAMNAAGVAPPDTFEMDGQLHRFHVDGDRLGSKNGWYVIYQDTPAAGRFGCWKRDVNKPWSQKPTIDMSEAEKVTYRDKLEAAKKRHDHEQAKNHAEARSRANEIWKGAVSATSDHFYLKSKGVQPHDIRISQNDLVVPVRNSSMELVGLQFIKPDGQKRFLSGSAKKGSYFSIGKPCGNLLVCEGVATGATLHEATGYATAVALDVGNLKPVAQAMRQKFPEALIVLCADDDINSEGNPGLTKATEAALAVGGMVAVPTFPERRGGKDTDFNDLAALSGLDEVKRQIDAVNLAHPLPSAAQCCETVKGAPDVVDVPDEANKQQSQAEVLLDIAKQYEIFHDQNSEGHIFFKGQCFKLRSKTVKDYLSYQMYKTVGKPPNGDALSQAISTVEGIARFEREEYCLENRVATHNNGFLYDLGDHRAVHITEGGWLIIDAPPKFRRFNHQSIQVNPIGNGDVNALFDFINVKPTHQLLILVTLISYFVPGIPHPIFHPWGPQGSGKTSLFKAFKRLVDPSSAETLMGSRDKSKVIHALVSHYLPLFDNLSGLNGEISDLLCQACTGGGIEQRKLFTDAESIIFQIHRCVGINGINLSIAKPDLLDRTLLLHLQRIKPDQRQEESVLWADFEVVRPHILGGIFDVLAKAIKINPQVKLDRLPRLADFGRWGYAIAEAIEEGLGQQFLADYQRNVDQQAEETIQSNSLATAVLSYMENRNEWNTTIGEAYSTLKLVANPDRQDKSFPAAHKELRRHLERLKPTLEEKGIVYDIGNRIHGGFPIAFRKLEDFTSLSTLPTSATPESLFDREPNVLDVRDVPNVATFSEAGADNEDSLPEVNW